MIRARSIHHPLHFRRPAGTSRGILEIKDCWYLLLENGQGILGAGEVAFIPGLSPGSSDETALQLKKLCDEINRKGKLPASPVQKGRPDPLLPGIRFAVETALADLENHESGMLFPSTFTSGHAGIPVNGLIWMGAISHMKQQVYQKVKNGFKVLKIKVGALSFEAELEFLSWIRSEFAERELELRLDANGAWTPGNAPAKLEALARFQIHSIEQPIAAGQPESMAGLCKHSPIPIALDEELIGIGDPGGMRKCLETIRPAHIILKPGLLGGFGIAGDWIHLAAETGIGWWVTSALESDVGLNAIAQWTATLGTGLIQGLGTGRLYRNNIPSPLELEGDSLWYRPEKQWDLSNISRA